MKIKAPSPLPLEPIAAVVITPVPEVKVKAILLPDNGAANVSALFAVFEPPDVLIDVVSVKAMLVPDLPTVV